MEKQYVFKNYREGNSKKDNKPYKMLELHDPATLENTTYYLGIEQEFPALHGMIMKDKLTVVHGITTYNGAPRLTIESLKKG